MGDENDRKRKKDKNRDDESSRNEKSKKDRRRSRSPMNKNDSDSYRSKRRRSRSVSPDASFKKDKKSENDSSNYTTKNVPTERKRKETDLLNTRTGGAYIPPARLRMMQAEITDKSSVAFQRLAWEALKKSIHGHINKINVGNIGIIIKQLLKENIVRGRGLLCRSVIQAQAASPTFTNVYAALVAAVNSRFPNIGELLLKRLVIQFKRGFKRNDKPICISSATFVAHLVNQRVAHEILALELLTLLVETPTDDSVEVAIAFLKECGQKLTEVSSKGVNAIFEMLRNILHEGQLDKRVQYMIEVMFQVWKDGFKDHPALIEELELVPEEEQFTHLLMLDDATDAQDILNVFKFDEKFEENEQKYKTLSKEILGSDAESEEEGESGESGTEDSDSEEEGNEQKGQMTIIDNTETNLVALRRTIYLTINSSLDFEECAHKLLKMQLKPGQEIELCHMFLDCCAEQRTYEKFYGLLAQRFCNINRIYIGPFEEIFKDSYGTAHRLDTNRLRNVSKFFAHLLFTDSISWEVLECVRLNEEDTTSSSRIYIKILFQELAEYMGLKKLNDRLKDPTLQSAFSGVFPRDNPKNTRFSINFFTSIGLGGLTDELREHLKQMPKNVMPPVTDIKVGSSSDSSSSSSSSSSDSSSSSSDDSDSSSDEETNKKKKQKDKTQKEKSPKSNEKLETEASGNNKDGERWGHDGFYDTYGKDAQRMERTDKDNFVVPKSRDYKRDKNYQKDFESTNGDNRPYRSRENETRRDDEKRRDDERRRDDDRKRDDERRKDDDRRRYDDRRRDDERRRGDERKRDDARKQDDERRRDDETRRDDERRRNTGDDEYRRDDERRRASKKDSRDNERIRDDEWERDTKSNEKSKDARDKKKRRETKDKEKSTETRGKEKSRDTKDKEESREIRNKEKRFEKKDSDRRIETNSSNDEGKSKQNDESTRNYKNTDENLMRKRIEKPKNKDGTGKSDKKTSKTHKNHSSDDEDSEQRKQLCQKNADVNKKEKKDDKSSKSKDHNKKEKMSTKRDDSKHHRIDTTPELDLTKQKYALREDETYREGDEIRRKGKDEDKEVYRKARRQEEPKRRTSRETPERYWSNSSRQN